MSTKTVVQAALQLVLGNRPGTASTALIPVKPQRLLPVGSPRREPIIIDMPRPAEAATLSSLLRIGRTYHPLCRNAFIEKRVTGYYLYEQRLSYHTCAVAAAYAGAFGPQSIERPDFSYSMALWRLSQKAGYDLNQRIVYGPTGRRQPVAEEMIRLVDENGWTREGVAEWLEAIGL